MNPFTRALLCLSLCVLAPGALTAELKLPGDGWASWQVDAVEAAPASCCYSWRGEQATPTSCRLDSDNVSYGSKDGATTDAIRVYAQLDAGKTRRVRALSANCAVQALTDIKDLGTMSADDSARWLAGLIQAPDAANALRPGAHCDALAALALHRGQTAFAALENVARHDAVADDRKEAVFWLAHMRGLPGAQVATSSMFEDESPDVREHAAFAVSLSKSPDAPANLIRLASTDANAHVRGQGWFWLAKTESTATEPAIGSALRKERDDEVRRQAIFALSQLPEERSTHALIEIAEDRSRSSEDRKQAIFWLAQSNAASAQSYLERILTAAAPVTNR